MSGKIGKGSRWDWLTVLLLEWGEYTDPLALSLRAALSQVCILHLEPQGFMSGRWWSHAGGELWGSWVK